MHLLGCGWCGGPRGERVWISRPSLLNAVGGAETRLKTLIVILTTMTVMYERGVALFSLDPSHRPPF